MKILTRYILKEVLSHAAIGAALFTFVIFMRDAGRILELVVRNSAPLPSVAEIFFLTLPTAFLVTIPMGVLVGILIGLSRLAADSEVTALRASGMGASGFLKIIMLFAAAAWLLALSNATILAPRSAAALAELQNSLKTSQASFEVQPRVFYEDFKNLVLYVQDVTPASGAAVWKNVFLADISNPAAPKITLAEEAVVIHDGPYNLRLHLTNGSQHENVARQPEQYTISTFEESDIPIDLPVPEQKPRDLVPVAQMTTAELLDASRDPDPAKARWYWTEFHRRFALPTACLVLPLVGVPLGLASRKGGKSTGFVLTIALVFIYYFASLSGVAMARQGKLPAPFAVWMANALFVVAGAYLMWRADRAPLEFATIRGFFVDLRGRLAKRTERHAGAYDRAATRKRTFSTNFPLLLDDLVLRDFVKHFALVLGAFVTLMLVFTFFELVGDIIRNRIPLIIVGEYLLTVLPYLVYLLTPLGVLIAVLVTFGLMEKSNEITAMKATGISVYRVVVPVLVVAFVLSLGLFIFDQAYLPYANKRQEVLRNTIKGRPAQTYLRPDRKWIFGQNNTIYFYEFFDPDRNTFGNISAFEFDPEKFAIVRRVYGQRAHYEDELGKWIFENGWTRGMNGAAIVEFRRFEVDTFSKLNEPPQYFKKESRQSSEMDYAELRRYIHDLQQSGFDVVRLKVQLHKKFAYPLIAFVMAVLAIPFSLSAGRRGALTGVAVSIGIAVIYWMTSGLFEAMGNVNQLPPALAAWAPNLLFALFGGYMALKVNT